MKMKPKRRLNFSKQVTQIGYQKNLAEEERKTLHSAMIEMGKVKKAINWKPSKMIGNKG